MEEEKEERELTMALARPRKATMANEKRILREKSSCVLGKKKGCVWLRKCKHKRVIFRPAERRE